MSDRPTKLPKKQSVPPCEWGNITNGGDLCHDPGAESLPAAWYYYYPREATDIPLCAFHKNLLLTTTCERPLHDFAWFAGTPLADLYRPEIEASLLERRKALRPTLEFHFYVEAEDDPVAPVLKPAAPSRPGVDLEEDDEL